MTHRSLLVAAVVLLLGTFEVSYGQSDNSPTTGEQRLIDDQRILPVPPDARFSEMMSHDYAMMMTSGAPTDDPQSIYPALRILVFAVPGSCSTLEGFYQQHWTGFKFGKDSDSGSAQFIAFLSWHGDELHQVPVKSIEDIDDSAEGVAIMASEHAPRSQDSTGFDLMRNLYEFSNDAEFCSVFVLNTRRVNVSDIPLSVRGVSSGDIYSSVSGLFNVVVPPADNFAVNRFSVAETSVQEDIRFAEEVSFLIGDFGELYRTGVIRTEQLLDPLVSHFQGELPGKTEQLSIEQVATDYGMAVQALYRVEQGSMLVHITEFDPIKASAPGDALVAVMVVPVGDYLVFATAQNDYLASESDESVSAASISSKTIDLINHLTWSRDLPGNAELPDTVKFPMRRPHVERCVRQFGTNGGVAFENTCEQRIAFQILMSPDEDKVIEYVIRAGDTLRVESEDRRYTFAACPDGYVVDKAFDRENLVSIGASLYNCSQR